MDLGLVIKAVGSLLGGGKGGVGGGKSGDAGAAAAIPPEQSTQSVASRNLSLNEPKADDGQSDFFTRFTKTILGKADADLTPQEMQKRSAKRQQANQLANSAMENPGESFMSAPNLGGGGFGLQDIAAFLRKF